MIYRAKLSSASDPTDGVGYAVIVCGLVAFVAGSIFLGTLASFVMGRPFRRTTFARPEDF